jgi:amino acid transporter
LFGFLFLWQSLLIGPLSIASGAVGFAQYAAYLAPGLGHGSLVAVGAAICLVNTGLLWRDVRSIGKVSILVSVVVVIATLWIVLSGAFHFQARLAFDFPAGAFTLTPAFWSGLGASTLIAVYDYGGYNNVCLIGDEVREPSRTIPVAVLVSIAVVAALYFGLNLAILGTVPWREAQHSSAIVADFMQRIYGPAGGIAVTILILIASWGSVLAVLLGYSRVPYAAAAAGQFFRPFARLHAKGGFPSLGLAYMGLVSALACFFSLGDLIAVLILVQMMFQFLAQCVAVALLRRRGPNESRRFRMPLYPVPVLVTAAGWLYIIATSQTRHVAIAGAMLAAGGALYLVLAARQAEWPFRPA